MNSFEVWTEGYIVTGNRDGASLLGHYDGESFAEAVVVAVLDVYGKDPDFDLYWNQARLTYWGCRFFRDEASARLSFG